MQLLEAVTNRLSNPKLLESKQGRLACTKYDPLLFAYIYLKHHLTAEDGSQTINEFHEALINYAMVLTKPIGEPAEYRDCFIAPRNTGKSTWVFTILTIWAAAHGHQKFIAAFSDSSSQAEEHLKTFVAELQENEKLKADFPLLCSPKMGGWRSRIIAQNRSQYLAESGFIFMARGADNAVLGMKVGTLRPSWIILDDIEKDESNYTANAVQQRLKTLQDAIFPLNVFAKVTIVGTTTRPGAILDQIRRTIDMRKEWTGDDFSFREALPNEYRWVVDEKFSCAHMRALIAANGVERSLWPEKWPLEWLQAQRHTRSFAKNYQCEPISDDADYWQDGDIEIAWEKEYGNTIISVDPAVSTNKRSDFTGIAVLSRGKLKRKRVYVRHVEQVKLGPPEVKARVEELIAEYGAKLVYVETNNGGDYVKQAFAGIPAKVKYVKQYEKKEIRAQRALDFYQRPGFKEVVHTAHFPGAEEQLLNFPKGLHDDMVDAITTGVLYFKRSSGGPAQIITKTYKEL
jgi:predicted phage terminase large subunit-like protein